MLKGVFKERVLGRTEGGKREVLKALKRYDRAVKSSPGDPELYFERGNYKLENQQCVDAILDYNRAIRLNCDFLEAYRNRALAKVRMSYYQGALADYEYILERNPRDEGAHRGRKAILERLK